MPGNMTFFVFLITLWTSVCSAQSSVNLRAVDRMAEILTPYVKNLDRDVWTFRYEAQDDFSPKTPGDLKPRLANWANRFWSVDIQLGADVGPGVYVATDPVATATWGRIHPRMFAIKIVQGAKILVGDQYAAPPESLKAAQDLAQELLCGWASTSMEWSLSSIVGFYRMNEKKECRQVIIEAFRRLSIQALTYRFNSAALEGCRTTGTAISIIDSRAVALGELNWYSEQGNIEGRPDVTPFIRSLYFEALPDLYSQSLIANRETLSRFRRAYGFFDHVQNPKVEQYRVWKNSSILKCGSQWVAESETPAILREYQIAQKHADPEIKELLIQLAVVYRERYELHVGLAGVPADFRTEQFRPLKAYPNFSVKENSMRLATGQVPNLTGVASQDRQEYRKILQDCLKEYSDNSIDFRTVTSGRCGVDRE